MRHYLSLWKERLQHKVVKICIVMIILLSFSNGLYELSIAENSQSVQPPEEEWNMTYGGTEGDLGRSVQQTSDGGYIIIGNTHSHDEINSNVFLVKIDENGNELWNNNFGNVRVLSDHGEWVTQTHDGGYILVGDSYLSTHRQDDIWLIKTDAGGNEMWNKTFGGVANDLGVFTDQTDDGGFIIIGSTEVPTEYYYQYDFWMIKTDENGNEEWNRTYGAQRRDSAAYGQQTMDGGYIIVGTTENYAPRYDDLWLVKTDDKGNEEWNRTYGGNDYSGGSFIDQTREGGYIITGTTRSVGEVYNDIWLIKTDERGNEEWNKTFSFGSKYRDFGESVQQTYDGGFIILGYTFHYSHRNMDLWVIKTDEAGNEKWNKTFGGDKNEYAGSILQTIDLGYLIVGGRSGDVWAIKLEKEEEPPHASIIGPISGTIEQPYEFEVVAEDPNGGNVYYFIDWGDDENSGWLGPFPSGKSISISHSWDSFGSYKLQVQAKNDYDEISEWSDPLTMSIATAELAITAPDIVFEDEIFTVTIIKKGTNEIVIDAEVTFEGSSILTDINGQVVFTSPSVAISTSFLVTAAKEGYTSAIKTITVTESKESAMEGWVYGVVSDSSGSVLSGVQVCVLISDQDMHCMLTDEQGAYNLLISAGSYSIQAEKLGYITQSKQTTITENSVVEINFNLEKSVEQGESQDIAEQFVENTILNQILIGNIGAKILVSSEDKTISYYTGELDIELSSTETLITLLVAGEETIPGTILVIKIGDDVFADIDNLHVTYDGDELTEITELETLFATGETTEPVFLRFTTKTGVYMFVLVPHFSEHVITIESVGAVVEAIGGVTALILYLAILFILGAFYMIPFFLIRKSK